MTVSNAPKSDCFPINGSGSEEQYGALSQLWERDGNQVAMKRQSEIQTTAIKIPYPIALELVVRFLKNVAARVFGKQSTEYNYLKMHLLEVKEGRVVNVHIKPLLLATVYTRIFSSKIADGLIDLAGRDRKSYELVKRAWNLYDQANNLNQQLDLVSLQSDNQRMLAEMQGVRRSAERQTEMIYGNMLVLMSMFAETTGLSEKTMNELLEKKGVKKSRDADAKTSMQLEDIITSNPGLTNLANGFINSSKILLQKEHDKKYRKI